ncbi:MAG: tetratricopeptide repeat protein [Eudoraea sp.]|nr:tetratricopeptide repeat protein [Eudoraea sp.]
MYKIRVCIFVLFISASAVDLSAQGQTTSFDIQGKVVSKAGQQAISGVEVSTDRGAYTLTNSFGEFKINVKVGDVITFQNTDILPVQYTVVNDESIRVEVEGYEQQRKLSQSKSKSATTMHEVYLDSARFYKIGNIEKSLDFIAQSIALLGDKGSKNQLAESLATLGEIYQHHQQFDLAIDNFMSSLEARKSTSTTIKLAQVYNITGAYERSLEILKPLLSIRNLPGSQRATLYELTGDAYKGLNDGNNAISFYQEGLKVARKNQLMGKIPDLNSKIADVYASENKLVEAEAFYDNSLQQAKKQAPNRAVQEKEKVADYFNSSSQFNKEIELRKESLEEIKGLSAPVARMDDNAFTADSITTQRINYKIANAYIAQERFDEAIPYLQESIKDADSGNDLVVKKDATRKLSEVYREKGEYNKALETYQQYVAVVDSLYIRKEQEISRAARFNREIAEKQSRITGLEQERELSQSRYDLAIAEQKLIQESNKAQRIIIYSLVLGLLLTGLTAFFFYRSTQQQKLANNMLALKSLRSQMNPHFIFNALNSVNSFIAKNDERSANRYLSDFSLLMRAVLENSEEDFIPLSKELELLELYVKLEHSRFPEKFDYKIKVDEQLARDEFLIPPMLLQPFIENAIWHGLRYKENKGSLEILLHQPEQDHVQITISDDGIGRTKSLELKTRHQKKQKSKGLGIINKRIAILNNMYKNKISITVSDLMPDQSGTKVVVTLRKA